MELANEFSVGVPLDEAWAVLIDLERIAPCIPGAELQQVEGEQFRGVVDVKVGPVTARYKGVASIQERDEANHRAVVHFDARDTRGQGTASGTVTATLEPSNGGTHVVVHTHLKITGKVAQFARGVLADVSSKLLRRFVEALEVDMLAGRAGVVPRAASPRKRGGTAVSDSDFDSIDFFRAGPLYQDPYPYYEYLREHGPVWREPHRGVVMVTGYEEAIQVYHDTDTFSNCVAVAGPFARWPVPLEGHDVSDIIEQHRDRLPFSDQLPTFDPPKHTAHRGLLGRLLTPKRLKENEEFMWRLADHRIDGFLRRGECEFIEDYAGPFTLLVVADLLGVPEPEHETFRRELQGEQRPKNTRDKDGAMAHKPLEFLYDRFTSYIEERRREPRADVMTALSTATFPDGTLPEVHDIMLIASNLFAAGGETTARLLGVMFQVIGERPALQQQLRDQRELLPNFIEECVRLETPLQSTFRLSRRATTIGDVEIPAGATVMLIPAAANRDPRKFEDPAEFRLGRPNWRQHLAFGSGVHACAGAPLARAEARVSAERLLDRLVDIRVSEKAHGPAGARRYEYPATYMLRGPECLHLEFAALT